MVNNFQWVNLRVILDRILRHPLLQELQLESAVQYLVDFLGIMGLPTTYIDTIEEVSIKEYRGLLPCNLISINQVRWKEQNIYLRSMTDLFNGSYSKENGEATFKTQGRVIFTSFKEGTLEISYKSIPVDNEGYPLLPDEPNFLRALELYIKKQWFTILFDMGKITPAVLQNTQQEYYAAAGACNNSFLIPSVSEMESIKGLMNQMIPRFNEFNHGFKHEGNREHLRIK